jgi:hypothetical protein
MGYDIVPPMKILFLENLRPLPFTSKWGLCDLWEIQAKVSVRFSLWALEHLSFVKQSSCHLLLFEVKPSRQLGVTLELPRLWWAVGKFMKARFASERKEARASEVRKAVERDPTWSWHLVGNSSYLNGDVGITGGDSKLWQTNPHVNPLDGLLVFLLSKLLEWLIVSIDTIGCMNRLLYLWSIPWN